MANRIQGKTWQHVMGAVMAVWKRVRHNLQAPGTSEENTNHLKHATTEYSLHQPHLFLRIRWVPERRVTSKTPINNRLLMAEGVERELPMVLLRQLCEQRRRGRRYFRWFHDHSAASRDSPDDRVERQQERVVPRGNDQHDAQRF